MFQHTTSLLAVLERMTRTILLLVALAAVLAGCAGSGEPDDYDDVVETNFMEACVEANERGEGEPALPDGDAEDYCGCVYSGYEENIPYEQFKAEDDQLRKDVESGLIEGIEDLSDDAQEIITACLERIP